MDAIVGFLGQYPVVMLTVGGLGSLVVVAQAVVVLTPSKADDAVLQELEGHSIWGKVIDWLKSMAVIQKKSK